MKLVFVFYTVLILITLIINGVTIINSLKELADLETKIINEKATTINNGVYRCNFLLPDNGSMKTRNKE